LVDAFEANVDSSTSSFPVSVSLGASHDFKTPRKSYQEHKLSVKTIGSNGDAVDAKVSDQVRYKEESAVIDVPPRRPALPPPSLLPDVVVCSTAIDERVKVRNYLFRTQNRLIINTLA
jgi:hypothetical protein